MRIVYLFLMLLILASFVNSVPEEVSNIWNCVVSFIDPDREEGIIFKYYEKFLLPENSKEISENAKWSIMIYSQIYFGRMLTKNEFERICKQMIKVLGQFGICSLLQYKEKVTGLEKYNNPSAALTIKFDRTTPNSELELIIKENEIALFDANFEYFLKVFPKKEENLDFLKNYVNKYPNLSKEKFIEIFGIVRYYTIKILLPNIFGELSIKEENELIIYLYTNYFNLNNIIEKWRSKALLDYFLYKNWKLIKEEPYEKIWKECLEDYIAAQIYMKLYVTKEITRENKSKYFAKEFRKWFFDIKTFAKLLIDSKSIGFLYYTKECLEDLTKKNKKNKKQNKTLTNEEKTDLAFECINKKIPLKLSGKEKLNEIHVNKLKEIFNDKNNNDPEIKLLIEKIKKAKDEDIVMLTDYEKNELLEIIDKGKKKQNECQLSDSSNASSSTTSQINIPIKNVETEEIENIKKENKLKEVIEDKPKKISDKSHINLNEKGNTKRTRFITSSQYKIDKNVNKVSEKNQKKFEFEGREVNKVSEKNQKKFEFEGREAKQMSEEKLQIIINFFEDLGLFKINWEIEENIFNMNTNKFIEEMLGKENRKKFIEAINLEKNLKGNEEKQKENIFTELIFKQIVEKIDFKGKEEEEELNDEQKTNLFAWEIYWIIFKICSELSENDIQKINEKLNIEINKEKLEKSLKNVEMKLKNIFSGNDGKKLLIIYQHQFEDEYKKIREK